MTNVSLETKGLPGSRSIREFLDLTQQKAAKEAGLHPHHLNSIECGRRDCTQALQRKIASALCCSVADLFGQPTPARLAEIRAAYLRRQADHAEAEAARMAEEQGAA